MSSKSKLQQSFSRRTLFRMIFLKWIRLILLVILGFATTFSLPALSTQPVSEIPGEITQIKNPQNLWQQGLDYYQASQFQRAINLWKEAVQGFENQGDLFHQASVLNNLSLAYQNLGEFEEAQKAIASSLELLGNSQETSYIEVRAKVFNTEGRLFWSKGEPESALESWKKAERCYKQVGQKFGIIGSQINQAKILQALGLSLQAYKRFASIAEKLEEQRDPYLQATGWLNFGKTLRQIGQLEKFECYQKSQQAGELKKTECYGSLEVLEKSLKAAKKLGNSALKFSTQLELGNTYKLLADKAKVFRDDDKAKDNAKEALEYYRKASQSLNLSQKIQAQLNELSLLIEAKNDSLIDEKEYSQIAQLVFSIQNQITNLGEGRNSIYSQLNYAQILMKLLEQKQAFQDQLSTLKNLLTSHNIAQFLADVLQQARILKDSKAESYALGQLGRLYEQNQQWSEAQNFTKRASLSIESIQAPHLKYLWAWQLGRLITKQGEVEGKISPEARQEAITAYENSIDALKFVRQDLLYVDQDIQFSFRDNVEPIYREFVDLLLRSPEGKTPSQENLKRAIEDIDDLQLAEIENFLGCDLSTSKKVYQDLDKLDPKAVFIYPIILEETLDVIYKFPGQDLRHFRTEVDREVVKDTLQQLRAALPGRDSGKVIENSQKVYHWLIAPLEEALENNSNVETLVFVLDGDLRNIPMAILYDVKTDQYLAEKNYAIVLLPSSQLFDLRSLPEQVQVLGAGISEKLEVKGLPPFKELKADMELNSIREQVSSEILLDSTFTEPNLQQQMNSENFSIVHLVTHGKFSSDPQETYILVYDRQQTSGQGELLRARQFDNLLRNTNQEISDDIELLVLSACQTATGDDRATLGLAGLAVRAGARSTLATLWQVSDDSTVELMTQFYQEFQKEGVTKAMALHYAQQALLEQTKYQNPFYWAPYVLVGNWR